ncbi:MAG: hypothetical protein ACI8XB_000021 [Patiriisocius sp.]|jgi:hypothetical protein
MDTLNEFEYYIIAIGMILLVILIIARLRISRKGKVVEEEDESFPIYQTKDILLQDRPHSDGPMGYIPSLSIGDNKKISRSILYLILVLILIWIILGFPISF